MTTDKKFLLLGGKPVGSFDMAQYAKSRGCYVIVCDYLPLSQSPAKRIADETWDYSTADVEKIASRCKSENIGAVFTGVHEFNLRKCCDVANMAGLPFYASQHEIDVTSNKRVYKDILKKSGITVIPEYNINAPDNIPDNIKYPILLKPIDGSGAYGLQICNSADDVKNKINECLKYSDAKQFIAEQYIRDKDEITSVYIIQNGTPYLASVADRIVEYCDNGFIPLPVQYIWNSRYLPLYEKTVDNKMRNAIMKMGLRNGMLFMQSIVHNNTIMPYDMGFRLSGTQEHVIIEEMCGYNPLKLLTDYALTGQFGNSELPGKVNPHFDGAASQITFLTSPGKIVEYGGLDAVEKIPGVIRTIINKEVGDIIPENARGTLNQVALRVFIRAKTRDDIMNMTCDIRNKIAIKTEKVK